jgi:hypothetical protein
MLRCLLPASGCALDVAFVLSEIGSPHTSVLMSAFVLAASALAAIPVLARTSRIIVGIELPHRHASGRRER